MEFIGKFHPLVLHLPIGFLIGALLLELIDWRNGSSTFNLATKILLGIGAATALLAALMGYLLSLQGGYDFQLLNIHQWTGFGLALASILLYFFRDRIKNQPNLLWSAWGANVLLLTIAGHYGGSLTHGEGYLVESAPRFIQRIFAGGDEEALNIPIDSAIIFEDLIQPIMEKKCWTCHNNGKSKGGLNLEVVKGWEKGGQTGPILVEGKPDESLLMQRIFLPMSDKEHMPPSGTPQLLPYEVALLEWWIDNHGTFETKVSEIKTDRRTAPIVKAAFGQKDIYEQIHAPKLSNRRFSELVDAGIKVLPIAQESPFLEVSFSGDTLISDEQISLLKKARKQIVRADFSRSGILDEQLQTIGDFPNLIHLELQQTNITDEGITYLEDLPYLTYLNLYNTKVSDEGVKPLLSLKNLKSLYLWQTNATKPQIETYRKQRPDMLIDFGIELDSLYQDVALEAPKIVVDSQMFVDKIDVEIKLNFKDSDIRFTLDGSDPDSSAAKYEKPIELDSSATIKAIAFKEGWQPSEISETHLTKIKYAPNAIKLAQPPHPKYAADGPKSLIDRKKGTVTFSDGKWLGWEKQHMNATIDLGQSVDVKRVTVSSLEAVGSYIFFPKAIEITVSNDNQSFQSVKKIDLPLTGKVTAPMLKSFSVAFPEVKARYVKIKAVSRLNNPDWHPAPGAPCWIFVDEIIVE